MIENIKFKNSKNENLSAVLSNPSHSKNNLILIMCHGFESSKESKTNLILQEELGKLNISILRFDFSGYNDSEGDINQLTVSQSVKDVISAYQFLKNIGYTNIGLMGSSFGGLCSFLATKKLKNLKFLVLKSPVSDFIEVLNQWMKKEQIDYWKEKGSIQWGKLFNKLHYHFYEDLIHNSVYKQMNHLNNKIPTFIVHGTDDSLVHISQSEKTVKLIQNVKLMKIKDADHQFSNETHFYDMIKQIINFISKF